MRLLLVWRADPSRAYSWMPRPAAGDVVISFDSLAATHLESRSPLRFDELLSWEDRSASEHRVSRLVAELMGDLDLARQQLDGYPLSEFISYRLRAECANVLRGWSAARFASGCTEVIAGPETPSALTIGARAALGLSVDESSYVIAEPPVTPSGLHRFFAQTTMRAVAAPSPARSIRVAAVMAAKVVPALAALSGAQRRAAGVGTMPFPGLDYGNSARLAVRWRAPMLATLDRARSHAPPQPKFRAELALGGEDDGIERALRPVVSGLVTQSWTHLAAAVQATRGLERARNLRALLLPTTAVGASQVLLNWARRKNVTVAAVQHGVYGFKEFDGGDSRADVLFAWSDAVADQARSWPDPLPQLVTVGVPGMPRAPMRPASRPIRHVLVATTGRPIESALNKTAFHEWFVAAVGPGLQRLQASGVAVAIRLHPAETRATYEAIFTDSGLDLSFAPDVPFPEAASATDLLVSAPSSVAFEAAALGVPLLLWTGGTPSDVRRDHLVAPWNEDLPGYFGDTQEFVSLVDGLLSPSAPTRQAATSLAQRLATFAMPFDAPAFASSLMELAG